MLLYDNLKGTVTLRLLVRGGRIRRYLEYLQLCVYTHSSTAVPYGRGGAREPVLNLVPSTRSTTGEVRPKGGIKS